MRSSEIIVLISTTTNDAKIETAAIERGHHPRSKILMTVQEY